jgi:hypothetical protein
MTSSQLVVVKPIVTLSTQVVMQEKTLEQLLMDISTQVLETNYVLKS